MIDTLKNILSRQIDLTDDQWAYISSRIKTKRTGRNEILLEKGEVARYLFFVMKGCLRIFLIDDEGNEFTRFLIFEGCFGTAFPSFTLQQPSAAAIQSIEASELLIIHYDDYQAALNHIPGWERMARKELELDYIDAIQRIESLISMDARQRYQLLMKKNPKLIQRLPNKIVADYLGISQETLSRLKKSPKVGKSESPKDEEPGIKNRDSR